MRSSDTYVTYSHTVESGIQIIKDFCQKEVDEGASYNIDEYPDWNCPKFPQSEILPDENNNCSLCGARNQHVKYMFELDECYSNEEVLIEEVQYI